MVSGFAIIRRDTSRKAAEAEHSVALRATSSSAAKFEIIASRQLLQVVQFTRKQSELVSARLIAEHDDSSVCRHVLASFAMTCDDGT